jgi:hypothetical protein
MERSFTFILLDRVCEVFHRVSLDWCDYIHFEQFQVLPLEDLPCLSYFLLKQDVYTLVKVEGG